ncbi:Trafficking protein particle complex subunit 31 [Ophidiomyces ophidiicola]|uniref:Trafficking protein particle complex subunit 31 n=1 Tax=Ophidiomyces ophidiicola TaxID=1387563 RepID=A0ACB8UXB6_9EURO|nr:Trafficking protein particle complex subunit 31 [Ophidiomyces ophidiicola]KAI1907356.1 Trafficking protein particle complex subunit 31 [Ophidiomyces ophidiicola]KAI1909748.1 Trafficking protein particle complex subunit 31 [Ophidiomyces ophidiicola]KAI1924645.1 Trafficking protein particle complex subunit 31 [Ophidiomyces ophidiicola]KAI1945193.1 Trafficking protein particle complex subunit 31 [Ophidiomyces ophidiicola]KAI1946599.1 Trafficking protein particle complex subunit 31 [Ophidiomyce
MAQNREEKHHAQHQQSHSVSQSTTERPSGLRVPSNRKTIYDRNLNRSRNAESSRASFAYLFAEMVTYAQRRVTGVQDLERRLNEQGYPLGLRLLDLLLYRTLTGSSTSISSNQPIRPLRIIALLQLIHGPLWRLLFSRSADALEHSVSPDTPNEYMITDNDPLTNMYISVPKEMGLLNCAAFVAGIVEGVCDGCGFEAKVTAHNQGNDMWPSRTVFLVKFGESVMEREKMLERAGIK